MAIIQVQNTVRIGAQMVPAMPDVDSIWNALFLKLWPRCDGEICLRLE